MKNWKKQIGFFKRLKLAWYAFWLKDYEDEGFRGYEKRDELNPIFECDVKTCPEPMAYCLSRSKLRLSVSFDADDHFHVCAKHAEEFCGRTEDRYQLMNNQKPVNLNIE